MMASWYHGTDVSTVLLRRGFRRSAQRGVWVKGRRFSTNRVVAEVQADELVVTARRASDRIPLDDPAIEARVLNVIRS